MKLLVIVHQFLPGHGAGSEYYTYYLAKELQNRGYEVHLYVTEIDNDHPHAHLRRRSYDGLPILEAINNHAFPDFRRTYEDPEMEANLRTVLDEVQPDLVHVQHLALHSLGYLRILAERGLKVVYTLHEYALMCLNHGLLMRHDGELCEGPELDACVRCAGSMGVPGTAEDVRHRNDLVREVLAHVDLFISPSAFLRDLYVEHGLIDAERIIHSDNGLELSKFQRAPKVPGDRLRVGYIGTISRWKGVHLLVEAFNGLPEEGVECRIFGDLTVAPDYVREIRRARTSRNLRFMGRFDNSGVAEVLAELDVLVVPSIWFENSPISIHEAFLAGVPVLCSDRGGMAELVEEGKCGMHFRMGDADDLRARIRSLMDDPGLLERMGSAFPEVKDIQADANDMERRYRSVLQGAPVA